MYSIKFGVRRVEYSVLSVECYWVVTGSKAWRKDLWRRLQNKSIIHWIFHRLLPAIWFMNSLKEVPQKKQKKLITKFKQWKLQWVPSQLLHPVDNTDSSLTQTTKLWNVILFWIYNCFKPQLQEICYFVSHSIVKFEFCNSS